MTLRFSKKSSWKIHQVDLKPLDSTERNYQQENRIFFVSLFRKWSLKIYQVRVIFNFEYQTSKSASNQKISYFFFLRIIIHFDPLLKFKPANSPLSPRKRDNQQARLL